MQCHETRKRMDAWMKNEVPSHVSEEIERHLEYCPACRIEIEAIEQISTHLQALPDVRVPGRLARKTRSAFRGELVRPGLGEWWKSLSFSMRGALCGVVATGLLCGAVLCNSITATGADISSDPYQIIYRCIGIL